MVVGAMTKKKKKKKKERDFLAKDLELDAGINWASFRHRTFWNVLEKNSLVF